MGEVLHLTWTVAVEFYHHHTPSKHNLKFELKKWRRTVKGSQAKGRSWELEMNQ